MADGRPVLFGVDHPDGKEEDHITTKLNLFVVLNQSTSVLIEEKLLRHQASFLSIFPQIALAIGVLTSNRGEGDEPLWRIGRDTRVPLQGAVDVVPLLGAIVGCHCSVLWLGGKGDGQLWGVDVVPHCRVPL